MARSQTDGQISIYGKKLMISEAGNLVSNGKSLGSPCVDATITVGAEAADVRQIAIVLKDAEGNALDYNEQVSIDLFLDAARVAYVVTGGSTGIALGTAAFGAIQTIVAKKRFVGVCKNDGTLSLQWTDTGTEVAFIGIRLPNGQWVMSSALTNA